MTVKHENETLTAPDLPILMGLPKTIEIVPLSASVRAEITVPGSKSVTNRALILAALADGQTILRGALWSEDTQVMVDCLQSLGFEIHVETDPEEFCNRTVTVDGHGGNIPNAGSPDAPIELHVGNAGTAARFLTAFACLGRGAIRLSGIPRMHERPQASLFTALREMGYRIDSETDRLPAVIHGGDPKSGECQVGIDESSQFASALLLTATRADWTVEITGQNTDNLPYVQMTRQLIDRFPMSGGEFQVEPDASSGSYIWGAGWLLNHSTVAVDSAESNLSVRHWPTSGWQIDAEFPKRLPVTAPQLSALSRERHLGDSIMTAIALAPLSQSAVSYEEFARLRVQECERVQALRTELTKCGANVQESGETLILNPAPLHGAEIETYNDHRMAMCFSVLGLRIPGLKIHNPACVKKTFPNFFQKLAATAPAGLGAEIREGSTGQPLTQGDLFAE